MTENQIIDILEKFKKSVIDLKAKKNAEIAELNESIEQLNQANADISNSSKEFEEKKNEEVQDLKVQLEASCKEIGSNQESIRHLEQGCSQLKTQLDELTAENNELKIHYKEAGDLLQEKESGNVDMQSTIESYKKAAEIAEQDKTSTQKFFDEQRNQLAEFGITFNESGKAEINNTKFVDAAKFNELQISNKQLTSQIEKYKNDISKLESQSHDLTLAADKKITEYENTINSLKVQIEELKKSKIIVTKFKNEIHAADASQDGIIHCYRFGKSSERVKDKFVTMITALYDGVNCVDGEYKLNDPIKTAEKENIGDTDRDVIIKRLMQMTKGEERIPILVKDNGVYKTKMDMESFINWITKIVGPEEKVNSLIGSEI